MKFRPKNPLAADFFVHRYSPQVLVLLRHPAAVAESCRRMGWVGDGFEDFGYCYGNQLAQAIDACGGPAILYEEFAKDPLNQFRKLLSFLDLPCPNMFETSIREFSENPDEIRSPYEVRRMSLHETDKWKRNLTQTEIDAVRKGYMRSALDYYREDQEWT